MRTIEHRPVRDHAIVRVPGSKSYTHRLLIAAALGDGISVIENPLKSEDTLLTATALQMMGIRMETADAEIHVHGKGGEIAPCDGTIDLGNSGTSMRLLLSLAALGAGVYRFTGTPRMQERPVDALLDALSRLGVPTVSVNQNGCPPVEITGGRLSGGTVTIDCSVSSQYLSSLLLVAPVTERGMTVEISQGPVSKPYIDMTVDIMGLMGIDLSHEEYKRYAVPGGQRYRAGNYRVEPDASGASYFWAAAAVTGSSVTVEGLHWQSRQGDIRLVEALEAMGCEVTSAENGITVQGGALRGVDIDMGDMPDMVPTLAIVAAFADGVTRIRNAAHLRAKESDRLAAVAAELQKMGISVREREDGLDITGGQPRGAVIETYDDHRIAMGFAVAGLKAPGTVIQNPECVAKSFPDFWEAFEGLYRR